MSVRLAFSIVPFIAFAWLMPFLAFAAPTCTLVANPTVVTPGQGFTLSLISSGATSANINNGIGTFTPNGSRPSISISATTLYTATVSGSTGTTTCSVSVIVDQTINRDLSSGGASGSGGGGGGANPAQMLQGAGQLLGGLAQLQNALGGNNAQNAVCNPVDVRCPCGIDWACSNGSCGCKRPGANMHQCACGNTTNTFNSVGKCVQPNMCLGVSSGGGSGPQAGGMQGLGGGLQALSSILQGLGSLMGGGGGGSGSGGGGSYYPQGCTQYYYTTTSTADPCAIYQPNYLSDNLYTENPNLGGVSGLLDYPITPSPTQTPISSLLNTIGSGSAVSPGATVEEREDTGVVDNLRKGFSEVADYFGGDSLERLCKTRPWAGGGALASVAPDGFFDTLCRRAGYSQGFGGTTTTSFGTSVVTPTQVGTTTNVAMPTAEIRAEPASVRLGTRTYIFWTSDNVVSCSVRGPSFEQNTLFGAGATVPITGPTSFVINCTAPDGTMVSDSVTVNLAI